MTFIGAFQLDSEPIIITSFGGKISMEDVAQSEHVLEQMYSASGNTVILIIDASQATLDFGEMIKIARMEMRNSARPSFNPANFKQLFVSTHKLVSLSVDLARQAQFGGYQFPLFHNLEDAITAARHMLNAMPAEEAGSTA